MASTGPPWHAPSRRQLTRSLSLGGSPPSPLESESSSGSSKQQRRSGSITPSAWRRRQLLGVPRLSTESLTAYFSNRAATPFRGSRSRSPRHLSESDALEAPGLQQEAITRAFLYPSAFHYNLRLACLILVMAHVSFKTILPCLLAPLAVAWTPRSLLVTGPF